MFVRSFVFSFAFILGVHSISFCVQAQELEKEITPRSVKELYFSGIQKFQKKEYQEAFVTFKQAVDLSPKNASLLHNFALSAMKTQKMGWAIGAWRKALSLDPFLPGAKALLKGALQEVQKKHSLKFFEDVVTVVNQAALVYVHLNLLLLLHLLVGFLFVFYLIKYFSQRKRAYLQDLVAPRWSKKEGLLSVLFLILTIASLFKILYVSQERVTLISKSAELKSAPMGKSSTLLEVFEGQHFILKKKNGEWVQLQMPGGLKGWTQKDQVF